MGRKPLQSEQSARLPGHRPRKRFGQNFLHDRGVVQQIIQAFDPDSRLSVIEIGPGKGALTVPLLEKTDTLHVIEIDTELAGRLSDISVAPGKLEIHVCDALKFDFSAIEPAPLQIIGNLPYNISTPLLFHLLTYMNRIKIILVMLQKELVDRICSSHGDPDYGRLSVMIQSHCHVEKLFNVAPGAFSPPPKVTSAVLRLLPYPERANSIIDYPVFERVVRHAFGQRRKTLRNALAGIVTESCLRVLSISPGSRAETVSVDDFIRIANMTYNEQNQ